MVAVRIVNLGAWELHNVDNISMHTSYVDIHNGGIERQRQIDETREALEIILK